jgi:hypothetical protein
MGKITYTSLTSYIRGEGTNKRAIITAQFADTARPDRPRIYNLSAVNNAIQDRSQQIRSILETVFGNSDPQKQDLTTLSESARTRCEEMLHDLDIKGLEFGREQIISEYKRLGFKPPKRKVF